jgi:hypothetical protein
LHDLVSNCCDILQGSIKGDGLGILAWWAADEEEGEEAADEEEGEETAEQ